MELHSLRKAAHPPLFQVISGRSLTRWADDAILAGAGILFEGAIAGEDSESQVYHGSLMMTVDPATAGLPVGHSPEEDDNLLQMLRKSLLFRMKLLRLARVETELRCAPALLGEMMTELEFKIEGGRLLIDIDILGPLMSADAVTGSATDENSR